MNHGASQLWAKGLPLDETVHRFTVGDDPTLDQRLLPFDALGSAAHARMLVRTALLTPDDAAVLVTQLAAIAAQARRGEVRIRPEQEDCHTAIETLLTQALGSSFARSRLRRSKPV